MKKLSRGVLAAIALAVAVPAGVAIARNYEHGGWHNKMSPEARARLEEGRLAGAKAVAEKMEGVTVQVVRKAGVDGRLFGSVSTSDIAEALVAQSFPVDKSMVRMPDGPLKTTGESQFEIALHSDVLVSVTVAVVGES